MAVSKPVTERQLKDAFLPMEAEIANMRDDVTELRDEFKQMKKVITGNGSGIGLDEQARNNRRDIDESKERIKELQEVIKNIQPLITFSKVGIWAGSAFGLLIIGLLWAIFTHQININYNP